MSEDENPFAGCRPCTPDEEAEMKKIELHILAHELGLLTGETLEASDRFDLPEVRRLAAAVASIATLLMREAQRLHAPAADKPAGTPQ
jgi:hypothetical protein